MKNLVSFPNLRHYIAKNLSFPAKMGKNTEAFKCVLNPLLLDMLGYSAPLKRLTTAIL